MPQGRHLRLGLRLRQGREEVRPALAHPIAPSVGCAGALRSSPLVPGRRGFPSTADLRRAPVFTGVTAGSSGLGGLEGALLSVAHDSAASVGSMPLDTGLTGDVGKPLDAAMRRLADGDRGAFDEVFDTLWPILRRYALRLLGDPVRAEDAAQRALLKMFERASSYDPDRSALAWALTFAFWECRTERTQLRRARSEQLSVELESAAETPEQTLGRLEWEQAARELVDQLPPEQRALVWAEVEPELAAVLRGQNPATVRKRRQRVLERLRSAFRLILVGEERS